jgi:hypothetical protein
LGVGARRDGGNWNNNALNNPATGVGGFTSASSLFAQPSYRIGISSKNTPESVTLNPGVTTFAPAGFHIYGTANVLP